MKKLLITTLAAVSVGFCAKAETAVFAENGVSFEESGVPAAGESLFGIKQVDGQDVYEVEGAPGWATDASTDDLFTVTNVSDVTYPSRPQMWDGKANTKALAIDTTVPLVRNADGLNGAAQDINTPIFFDSVVQFTATDVATAPSAEDKLLVWLYASEGVDADNPGIFGETEAITNLVITAGYYEGSTLLTTNYLTNVAIEPESWHRLTIKSSFTGGFVKFGVWVDGTTAVTVDGVSEFYSLVEDTKLNYNVLTGVAFDGKGAVDDLVFTATDPFYVPPVEAEDANLKITFNDFSAIDVSDMGVGYDVNGIDNSYYINTDSTEVTLKVGDKVSVWFGLLDGYELVSPVVEADEDGYYIITIDALTAEGATIAIVTRKTGGSDTVTVGGTPVEIGTDGKISNITTAFDGKAVSGELDTAMFKSYYTATVENGNLSIKLDQKAAAPFAEATDLTDGQEVFDLDVTMKDDENNDLPAVGIRIKTFKGLYYGLGTATQLGSWTNPASWTQSDSDGKVIQLVAPKQGDTGFYKIEVRDVNPTPAP